MIRLYLVRHGIAVPRDTPDIADDDRPLTPKGERRIRQVAQGLLQIGVKLDRLISSPLPRALRTAEIVADILKVHDRFETADELHASRSADQVRERIHTRQEQCLMLVGHDPAFSDLVGLLIRGEPGPRLCQIHKGGVAALRTGAEGGIELDWLARPRLIRRLLD